MSNLKKTALITGGADRIGKAIALTCAGMGYDVALHYRNSKEKAELAKKEIEALGRNCSLYYTDLADADEAASLVAKVRRDHNLFCLVNNASIYSESSLVEGDSRIADEIYDVNFKAPYLLTKEFAQQKGQGVVINLLDTKISGNMTRYFDYLLSKKFLFDYTKMAAIQLAPNIRVNGIAPGAVLPPAGESDEYLENISKTIPLRRPGAVKYIQKAVQYILENDFITGEILNIDGGENLL